MTEGLTISPPANPADLSTLSLAVRVLILIRTGIILSVVIVIVTKSRSKDPLAIQPPDIDGPDTVALMTHRRHEVHRRTVCEEAWWRRDAWLGQNAGGDLVHCRCCSAVTVPSRINGQNHQ